MALSYVDNEVYGDEVSDETLVIPVCVIKHGYDITKETQPQSSCRLNWT